MVFGVFGTSIVVNIIFMAFVLTHVHVNYRISKPLR